MEENRAEKVAVITGASSGIGYASAIALAREGYHVVLASRRKAALREVAEKCELENVQTLTVVTDTTDEAAVHKLAQAAVQKFGHFDVWINGAAVSLFAKFEEAPLDAYRKVIETDLFGYIYGSREAIIQFKAQGFGVLINISSVVATAPQPYASAYVASKYAVRGLSESIRMELVLDKERDIHVCTVMPASIDTNFFQNAANFTGRNIRALNPVYDPGLVAEAIVSLTTNPKREVIVGAAGKMMAAEHATMPGSYEKMVALFIDKDHLGQDEARPTNGALYEPLTTTSSIRGGWQESRVSADQAHKIAKAGLLAGVGLLTVGWALSKTAKAFKN